ncbi:transglutaminase family protein [Anianabacter salinae]|uniref:transglutaminase family protein n=1 Tax=Anianabacter salinae TaxID=2851023 RepID=UPI00225E1A22|nr:transglutaminase family protein [Anianabacter salinae]MBV0914091.1 transglutaminase family protein [Anianabacter salinae]
MRLHVTHTTTYRFSEPVRGLVQSLRMRPAEFEGQTIIEWSRTVTDAVFGAGFHDGAGDFVETASIRGFVSQIEVTNEGIVETSDMAGVLRGHRERIAPEVYLQSTDATEPDPAIAALAETAVAGIAAEDVLERAHALSAAVQEALVYSPGETDAHTRAAEALEQGKGVCQDLAHLLIAAARAAGIPARYVCGYLHTDGADDLIGASASHAWAELHVPALGWVAFDPTNGVCPDERYVRLGSGLDAEDAAPIRGIVMGRGDETLDVTVAVQNMQQQQS